MNSATVCMERAVKLDTLGLLESNLTLTRCASERQEQIFDDLVMFCALQRIVNCAEFTPTNYCIAVFPSFLLFCDSYSDIGYLLVLT